MVQNAALWLSQYNENLLMHRAVCWIISGNSLFAVETYADILYNLPG